MCPRVQRRRKDESFSDFQKLKRVNDSPVSISSLENGCTLWGIYSKAWWSNLADTEDRFVEGKPQNIYWGQTARLRWSAGPYSVGNAEYLATLLEDEVCHLLQNELEAKSLLKGVFKNWRLGEKMEGPKSHCRCGKGNDRFHLVLEASKK